MISEQHEGTKSTITLQVLMLNSDCFAEISFFWVESMHQNQVWTVYSPNVAPMSRRCDAACSMLCLLADKPTYSVGTCGWGLNRAFWSSPSAWHMVTISSWWGRWCKRANLFWPFPLRFGQAAIHSRTPPTQILNQTQNCLEWSDTLHTAPWLNV